MITRIFDIAEHRANTDADGVLFAAKENETWRTYTSAEAWKLACRLANGLLAAGVGNIDLTSPERQEKIAIISNNRPEWMMADLAVQLTGAVLTPIYPTIAPTELAFILGQADITKVFISGDENMRRFRTVLTAASLSHIISFDDEVSGTTFWQNILSEKRPARPQHHRPDYRRHAGYHHLHQRHHRRAKGRDAQPPKHREQRDRLPARLFVCGAPWQGIELPAAQSYF